MGRFRMSNPLRRMTSSFRKMSLRAKVVAGVFAGIAAMVLLQWSIIEPDFLFVISECIHALGILVLNIKLKYDKNCAGLSLKTQMLTAIFLVARFYCSIFMEFNIHTILDVVTLANTAWAIYMMKTQLRDTYMKEKDDMNMYYVLVPCLVLALLVHPNLRYQLFSQIVWAFCLYLESVSVLPQLRLMQQATLVEPFTAFYVFALGVSRFFSCAHWILQVWNGRGYIYFTLGLQIKNRMLFPYGLWPAAIITSELVHTLILADFCYYYIKSIAKGQLMVRLPDYV